MKPSPPWEAHDSLPGVNPPCRLKVKPSAFCSTSAGTCCRPQGGKPPSRRERAADVHVGRRSRQGLAVEDRR
eukprot:289685-Pyramimonas_sp.AAC.1